MAEVTTKNYRDSLTGCLLPEYIAEFEQRAGDRIWGCIYVYIDHFKQYKDRNGWDAGQLVLQKMSRFLMRHVRADEDVVRLKDDEFLILILDVDLITTRRVARRIQMSALNQAPVTFSIGSAVRDPGEEIALTIPRAARNLNIVKVMERPPKRERRKVSLSRE